MEVTQSGIIEISYPRPTLEDALTEQQSHVLLTVSHSHILRDLANPTRRRRGRENGVIFPYMAVSRHFHAILVIHSLPSNMHAPKHVNDVYSVLLMDDSSCRLNFDLSRKNEIHHYS